MVPFESIDPALVGEQPQFAPTIAGEIERYLQTGDSDALYRAWPGGFFERAKTAHNDLRGALVQEVHRLGRGRTHPPLPILDTTKLTRTKVAPMIRGLFPQAEQEIVLAKVEQSVVFLTNDNIERLLFRPGFDHLAWTLANLYLASLGAPLLGEEAPNIVGLSEESTCYVSANYFQEEDPFADFIVHEVAHIFHNCKRATFGLRETRRKEWLLDIDFRKRETFAYSCEAYSRIVERGKSPTERQALSEEFGLTPWVPDGRVDATEVSEIVRGAAAARNGWKLILARCAPTGPK